MVTRKTLTLVLWVRILSSLPNTMGIGVMTAQESLKLTDLVQFQDPQPNNNCLGSLTGKVLDSKSSGWRFDSVLGCQIKSRGGRCPDLSEIGGVFIMNLAEVL